MAAVANYPKPTAARVWSVLETESSFETQGSEGLHLHWQAREAALRWNERAEFLIAARDEDDDPMPYVSVPPNRTFYVKTRFVYLGKGKPSPFDLEDE